MTTLSIREYDERLATLASAEPTPEGYHQAIGVAKGLLATLRNWGTPAVQAVSPKTRAQSLPVYTRPTHLMRPAGAMPAVAPTRQPAAPAVQQRASRPPESGKAMMQIRTRTVPEHLVDVKAAAEMVHMAVATLRKHCAAGTFAAAVGKHGRTQLYERAAVLEWHRAEKLRRAQASAIPAGMLTTEMVTQRIGNNITYLWHMMARGVFPKEDRKFGKRLLWSEATVEAWLRAREKRRAAPRLAPPAPEGHLTAKQLCQQIGRTDVWLYMAMESQGFPKPALMQGRHPYWSKTDVRAWLAAPPPTKGKHNTRKKFGTV